MGFAASFFGCLMAMFFYTLAARTKSQVLLWYDRRILRRKVAGMKPTADGHYFSDDNTGSCLVCTLPRGAWQAMVVKPPCFPISES